MQDAAKDTRHKCISQSSMFTFKNNWKVALWNKWMCSVWTAPKVLHEQISFSKPCFQPKSKWSGDAHICDLEKMSVEQHFIWVSYVNHGWLPVPTANFFRCCIHENIGASQFVYLFTILCHVLVSILVWVMFTHYEGNWLLDCNARWHS